MHFYMNTFPFSKFRLSKIDNLIMRDLISEIISNQIRITSILIWSVTFSQPPCSTCISNVLPSFSSFILFYFVCHVGAFVIVRRCVHSTRPLSSFFLCTCAYLQQTWSIPAYNLHSFSLTNFLPLAIYASLYSLSKYTIHLIVFFFSHSIALFPPTNIQLLTVLHST